LFFCLGAFVMHMGRTASFVFAIGIIVANVPEGLLPTVTLALAMGTQRMAKRHALIKKLSSVETLGCTTVICTDKTGTLTTNQMTVREIWVANRSIEVGGAGYKPDGTFTIKGRQMDATDNESLLKLLRVASFCNNSRLLPPDEASDQWSILGDPTEAALLVSATKFKFDYEKELQLQPRTYEIPFDSRRKRMSTAHIVVTGVDALVKGAPMEVLSLCTKIWEPGGEREITEEDRKTVTAMNDEYARQALRVLGFAYRPGLPKNRQYEMEELEKELTFVGLAGMMDPPRPEVEQALDECRTAGIKVIMITGDYGVTAESVARRIGLVRGRQVRVISGLDIDEMSSNELGEALSLKEVIFARRARFEGRGYRCCHGHIGNRRGKRCRRDDPDRRQLRVNRQRHRGRPRGLYQHKTLPDLYSREQHPGDRPVPALRYCEGAASVDCHADTCRGPWDRPASCPCAWHREARARDNGPAAAAEERTHVERATAWAGVWFPGNDRGGIQHCGLLLRLPA
jgi:magnesium-transporting ATPase (P-type)